MNFFQHLSGIEFDGSLNLTIKKSGDQLVVSTLLKNDSIGSKVKDHIPPLILRGTPAELDAGFVAAISDPIREVNGLIVGVESFNKQKEVAAEEAAKTTGTKPEPKKPAGRGKTTTKPAETTPEPATDLTPSETIVTSEPEPIAVTESAETQPQADLFDLNDDDEEIDD